MLGLMALRQTLTLIHAEQSNGVLLADQLTEIPGLVVSVLAFLSVYYFGKMITESKKSEFALQEKQEILKGIIDNSTNVIYTKDLKGRYLQINGQFENVSQLSRKQIINKTDHQIFPRETADTFRNNDQKVIEANAPFEFEEDLELPDGLHTYISMKFPLLDLNGSPRGVCGITTDITERKKVEQELERQKNEYEVIFNSAPAFIFYKDDQNNILRVNKAVADSLGLEAKEMEGKHSKEFYPDHYEKYYADDLEVLNSGKPKLGIVEPFILSTGEKKWVRTDKILYKDKAGKIQGIIVFAIDITKQKEAEIKTKEYSVQLEEINKELQSFASIASHDLQEPLRKIITFGDLLASRISEADIKGIDYLHRMQKSASRMRILVEDLLQFTRVENKPRDFEPLDLNKVVRNVLEDLETRIDETKGEINFTDLPVIDGDPVQMHQLFLNLIGNALKFHREGIPPVVALDCVEIENGFWEITVKDYGIGIKEEHVDKIFKPFERLHGRTTYEGTGIGLTICNKIVTRHGGKISVKRQSTHGVTFHITLPEKQNNDEVVKSFL